MTHHDRQTITTNTSPIRDIFGLTAADVLPSRRLILATVCAVLLNALLLAGAVHGSEICKPTRYADGDTFTFMRGSEGVRVRVAGFDAPEHGQPFAVNAAILAAQYSAMNQYVITGRTLVDSASAQSLSTTGRSSRTVHGSRAS